MCGSTGPMEMCWRHRNRDFWQKRPFFDLKWPTHTPVREIIDGNDIYKIEWVELKHTAGV